MKDISKIPGEVVCLASGKWDYHPKAGFEFIRWTQVENGRLSLTQDRPLDIQNRKPLKCKCVKNNCKQPKLFGKEALAVGGSYKCEHDDDSSVAKEKNMKKVTFI